jgi:predicted nucleic acid-binding protein
VRFVDTNVLLYSVSTEMSEAGKRATAAGLLDAADLALSAQVLQEFYVQVTRPTRAVSLSSEGAKNFVRSFARFPVVPITVELVLAAIETSQRFRISYWDAAIIEAARQAGCAEVLSEDISHGQDYDGVEVRNPFL